MFTSLITAYVNIIHAKFQSQSQQYPIIFRLLNISRENIVTLFRLPLIFTFFLCVIITNDYSVSLMTEKYLFLFSLLYPTTCITVLKSLRQKIHLFFLFYHIYIYIYIQYYIKFPFIITLEDNDTIPNSLNVPRLHNIQPFAHRLSKFTTNRNVSIIFHQKLY